MISSSRLYVEYSQTASNYSQVRSITLAMMALIELFVIRMSHFCLKVKKVEVTIFWSFLAPQSNLVRKPSPSLTTRFKPGEQVRVLPLISLRASLRQRSENFKNKNPSSGKFFSATIPTCCRATFREQVDRHFQFTCQCLA